MPKIVYPVCCGIDVHKSFVVACVATTDAALVTTYRSKRFSTFTGDLRRLAEWLSQNRCKDVCMESTGKYWIPVWNILEPTCRLVLAHPKYVKAIKGKKTDKRDAKWIADIFKHDLINGSFIPPADIRQLRDLVRYRFKLTSYTTGEKNRAQNCLTVSNIKLDDVFSDVFGKSASAITERLLESNEPFDVAPYVSKKCQAPMVKHNKCQQFVAFFWMLGGLNPFIRRRGVTEVVVLIYFLPIRFHFAQRIVAEILHQIRVHDADKKAGAMKNLDNRLVIMPCGLHDHAQILSQALQRIRQGVQLSLCVANLVRFEQDFQGLIHGGDHALPLRYVNPHGNFAHCAPFACGGRRAADWLIAGRVRPIHTLSGRSPSPHAMMIIPRKHCFCHISVLF